ncbi:hypothetical protein [Desulforhabdus sp. TSK]|uniref:hypothetical protein n=1 Tax=Desulforhabdus sp. TSK TaxID=2925014 RepID=UPI001FC85BF5|nr:hypothetical protein [Desulforhabdus sp. TSK]GKT08886.1 hypothetical protein DSTSK_21910 [Desulforhabdus sp. TSK]
MEAVGQLVKSVPLENGLTVFFHSVSKNLPGGRCQLHLLITIPLEIKEGYFQGCESDGTAIEAFRKAGPPEGLCFRQEKVRNFTEESEVENVLGTMCDDFLRASRSYLSKADFEKKSVLRKFMEWKEGEAIRKARELALQASDQGVAPGERGGTAF